MGAVVAGPIWVQQSGAWVRDWASPWVGLACQHRWVTVPRVDLEDASVSVWPLLSGHWTRHRGRDQMGSDGGASLGRRAIAMGSIWAPPLVGLWCQRRWVAERRLGLESASVSVWLLSSAHWARHHAPGPFVSGSHRGAARVYKSVGPWVRLFLSLRWLLEVFCLPLFCCF